MQKEKFKDKEKKIKKEERKRKKRRKKQKEAKRKKGEKKRQDNTQKKMEKDPIEIKVEDQSTGPTDPKKEEKKPERPVDLWLDYEEITKRVTDQIRRAISEQGWTLDVIDAQKDLYYLSPSATSSPCKNEWAANFKHYFLPLGENKEHIVVRVPHWFWRVTKFEREVDYPC